MDHSNRGSSEINRDGPMPALRHFSTRAATVLTFRGVIPLLTIVSLRDVVMIIGICASSAVTFLGDYLPKHGVTAK